MPINNEVYSYYTFLTSSNDTKILKNNLEKYFIYTQISSADPGLVLFMLIQGKYIVRRTHFYYF